jgi:hypothetical protein
MSLGFWWELHWICRSLSVMCYFPKSSSAAPWTWEVFPSSHVEACFWMSYLTTWTFSFSTDKMKLLITFIIVE